MPDSALRFEQVSKTFGTTVALQSLTLTVRRGEFFALAGVNGAGKTTLIKCLLDFCEPDAGAIEIFGVPHRQTKARQPLGFLPEQFVPPYYLTGRDFLRLFLALNQRDYDPSQTATMLQRLDFNPPDIAKPARLLSKGMTQKLGLAACLLAAKSLYVLDEPMSGLDPKARAMLKAVLFQLKQQGATVFFTSHALADIEELCDRMAILHAGQAKFCGTPAELRQQCGGASLEEGFLRCIQ